MKTIKKHLALAIVMALIMAGALLLMFDYETTAAKWMALIGAGASFASGLYIARVFNRKKMLPE